MRGHPRTSFPWQRLRHGCGTGWGTTGWSVGPCLPSSQPHRRSDALDEVSEPVGMILGTEDATPLTFWVGVSPDAYLQLDDAGIVDPVVPGRGPLPTPGTVQAARAR